MQDRLSTANTLYAINQTLPPEHQVRFSTKMYKEEIEERQGVICNNCKAENRLEITKTESCSTTYYDSLLGADTGITYVQCHNCNTKIQLSPSAQYVTHKVNIDDYKADFAPEEPSTQGIMADATNAIQFWQWAYTTRSILMSKLRQFRESYQNSKGDGML